MNDVIYRTATSLNGFIADEANSLEWLFAVEHAGLPDESSFLERVGVLVMGSTSYEWVMAHTEVLERPEQWREFYRERPSYVFTSRALPSPPGVDVRFVNAPVARALPDIRAAAGGRDVWVVGGGDLAGQFADVGALDRIELTVAPVALPGGAPLLPRRLESDRLRLASVERHGAFVDLVYTIDRADDPAPGRASPP